MAGRTLTVEVAGLPAFKEMLAELQAERDSLRNLCVAWEQRVVCLQCGERYTERACGPTHAAVAHLVKGPAS